MDDLTITHHGDASGGEYRAHVPGSDEIGRMTWFDQGGARVVDHTLVPPALGNRGIAGKLVERIVEDARSEGFKVRPLCSYVVAAFRRHPEWADIAA